MKSNKICAFKLKITGNLPSEWVRGKKQKILKMFSCHCSCSCSSSLFHPFHFLVSNIHYNHITTPYSLSLSLSHVVQLASDHKNVIHTQATKHASLLHSPFTIAHSDVSHSNSFKNNTKREKQRGRKRTHIYKEYKKSPL